MAPASRRPSSLRRRARPQTAFDEAVQIITVPLHKRPVPTVATLVGLLVVVLLIGVAFFFAARSPVDVGQLTISNSQPYASLTDGYHLRYPAKWSIERRDAKTKTLVLTNGRERIAVMSFETAPGGGLFTDATVPVTIQDSTGTRYRDFDPTTLTAIDRIVLPRPKPETGFVEIRGTGPSFEAVAQSFRFIKTP